MLPRHLLTIPVVFALVLSGSNALGQETSSAEEAAGPTLEEVLERHYQARGGLDAIRAVDQLEIVGVLSVQGFEIPFTAYRSRPNRYRMEMDIQGMEAYQVYDGEMAWGVNPMTGATEPAPLSDGEARSLAAQADFDGVLVDYRRKRAKVELVGKETRNDREVYRLEAVLPTGDEATIFLDAETFLETGRTMKTSMNGQEVETKMSIPEYREVEGVQMPAVQQVTSPMGTAEIRFDEYRVGADIDPEIYLMPGQMADAELSLLQVVEKYRAVRGNEKARAVETLKASGKLGLLGFQVPLTMVFERPRKARLDADIQGLKMTLAFDGENAWTVSPMQGITEPEALPSEAAEAIALFADFLWGLMGDSSDWEMELLGVEKVERDETYKLRLSREGQDPRDLYLGGEDFLERKLHLKTVFMGTEQELDAILSDYREVEGLMVPHAIEILTGGNPAASVEIESVEVDAEIEAGIFEMPAPSDG